ncbi:hypothetical protein V6Z11_A03G037600 [Gossypium hirsutum]
MVVDVHKGAISDNMKYQCFTALKGDELTKRDFSGSKN